MKQVLIIIESLLLREYISQKLEENGVNVSIANGPNDGISKIRNLAPDLIIMDYLHDRQAFMELLKQKKLDLNAANTPVIIFAQEIEQKELLELVPYNVKKVFNKPVKIDSLFKTLSEILGAPFTVDESPGIMEVHVNESILFIEIAQGLNRDKLDLLRFKISELLELYKIRIPKVIIMLSNVKLNFSDAPNLQKLLRIVLTSSRAKQSYVRILTKDDFINQFIKGQKEYENIEVSSNLQQAIKGLLADASDKKGQPQEKGELIENVILQAKTHEDEGDLVFKFDSEEKKTSLEIIRESLQNIRIAVIDDDFVIQEMIKSTFQMCNANVFNFPDGEEFLRIVDTQEFDLAFLDMNMPKIDGFGVLKALQIRNVKYPIIVLSSVSQREAMIKSIQMGVKSYLVKPLKPEDIFMKSIEILKANF